MRILKQFWFLLSLICLSSFSTVFAAGSVASTPASLVYTACSKGTKVNGQCYDTSKAIIADCHGKSSGCAFTTDKTRKSWGIADGTVVPATNQSFSVKNVTRVYCECSTNFPGILLAKCSTTNLLATGGTVKCVGSPTPLDAGPTYSCPSGKKVIGQNCQ